MKQKESFIRHLLAAFFIFALIITIYVLFHNPRPGVADQGDFYRVMSVSGLELPDEIKTIPDSDRFYDYIITDYKISDHLLNNYKDPDKKFVELLSKMASTSMTYLILFISSICKLFGKHIFNTEYLAIAYIVIYFISMFLIFKYINIKNKASLIFFVLISSFIFWDGNYLVWFNSLYGEPMMVTTLMLYISAWIYYIYNRKALKSKAKNFLMIIFIFITAFLFLGSKMQVITALPFILFMLGKLLLENRSSLNKLQLVLLCILFFVALIYPIQMNINNGSISKDTQYNSVFSGILKNSKTPRKDLIDLGLNPDMSVEAGKHAYLEKNEYVKYVPNSEITEKEFYSKISNGKIAKFYITHPVRLIQAMEYTANHAFFTGTSLGKYKKSYSEEPIRKFHRFTYWSDIRNNLFPKNLAFIITFYCVVFGASIITYVKNKDNAEIRDKIQLFWNIALIGIIQFPMPFIGNGDNDTTKQLFLFNFTFDIVLVTSLCWCLNILIQRNNKRNTPF